MLCTFLFLYSMRLNESKGIGKVDVSWNFKLVFIVRDSQSSWAPSYQNQILISGSNAKLVIYVEMIKDAIK
jgi:hypothetical protein